MKNKIHRLYPLGYELKIEFTVMILSLATSLLYSFTYLDKFYDYYGDLFEYIGNKRILLEYSKMEDFYIILDKSLVGFAGVILIALFFAVVHYTYHYSDSKSIYLMKRLPKKNELHIRCLTLPVIYIATSILAAFLLLLLYYFHYMSITPDECLTPDQWVKLWRSIL